MAASNAVREPGTATQRRGVVFAAMIGNAVSTTPAVHSVFGAFLIPLSESFDWPRVSISFVFVLLALTGAIGYPLAGRFADRHGARGMILSGNILLGLSICLLAASNGSLLIFYLTFTLIGIFGVLPSTPMFSRVVAQWFDRNRGTALGLSAGVGNGLGSMLFPIVAALLVTEVGWRYAYLGIGVIVIIVGFPVLYRALREVGDVHPPTPEAAESELRDVDKDGISASSETLRDAMRKPVFWLLTGTIAMGAGVLTAIFSHIVPILADRGYDIGLGTTVVSVYALVGSFWQLGIGRLLDVSSRPRIVAPAYAMAVAGLACLGLAESPSLLLLGGVFLGLGLGTQYGSLPFLVSRYFATGNFGTILGVMYSAIIVAQGLTPVLLDYSFDVTGSYSTGLTVATAALGTGSLLLFFLPRYRNPGTADRVVLH